MRTSLLPSVFVGVENKRFVGTPDDAVAYVRSLVAVGVRYFIVGPATESDRTDAATLRRLAEEVIPAIIGS